MSEAMVDFVDVVPTLVDLAGGTPRPDLPGRSFRRVLEGQTTAHRDWIFSSIWNETTRGDRYPIRAVQNRTHKYIVKGEVRLEGQGDERVPRGGEALRVCARLEPRVDSNQVWVDEAVKNALDTEGSYYCARPVTSIEGLTPSEDAKFNIGKDHEPPIMLEVFRIAPRD